MLTGFGPGLDTFDVGDSVNFVHSLLWLFQSVSLCLGGVIGSTDGLFELDRVWIVWDLFDIVGLDDWVTLFGMELVCGVTVVSWICDDIIRFRSLAFGWKSIASSSRCSRSASSGPVGSVSTNVVGIKHAGSTGGNGMLFLRKTTKCIAAVNSSRLSAPSLVTSQSLKKIWGNVNLTNA